VRPKSILKINKPTLRLLLVMQLLVFFGRASLTEYQNAYSKCQHNNYTKLWALSGCRKKQ